MTNLYNMTTTDLLKAVAAEEVGVFLTSNLHRQELYGKYDLLACGGVVRKCMTNDFEALQLFLKNAKGWVFGGMTYDMKNNLEKLVSNNHNRVGFEGLFFFEPAWVVIQDADSQRLWKHPEADLQTGPTPGKYAHYESDPVTLTAALSQEEYIRRVQKLQDHIQAGDIYEVTFCTEFFAEGAQINPAAMFNAINHRTQAPFAAFLKWGERYLMAGSPERYLAKRGATLISQPIKGTAPRFVDAEQDAAAKLDLKASQKERSENVMIVDLVRNDLSRVAVKGSVAVPELFGIHTFATVHQMISTVTARLDAEKTLVDAFKATFPMGSMTGAPKIRAMQLIEDFEPMQRGLFSGTVGYVDPEGDADFNVVIRALQYHAETGALSLQVGSAITILANPEHEYQECLLKARAIHEVLANPI
jgi:para-aminobenzoate synthetase component 1